MKYLKIAVIGLMCMSLLCIMVSADDTVYTDTYTHWSVSGGQRLVASKPLYEVKDVSDLRSLQLSEDAGVFKDVDCDENGTVYVLTDQSRILRFDSDNYCLLEEYKPMDESGEPVQFAGAQGISVISSNELYIADTKNARVLYCKDGILSDTYLLPESDLIPDGFNFQPIKVARDSRNYLYVVSSGSYYGALLYNPQGEFIGFYGANTVSGGVLTTLGNFWDNLTQNDEKRARLQKILPYDFSDLCIDKNDFVYTCTGTNASGNIGQIRILSPGGANILRGSESRNFGETEVAKRLNAPIRQNFCSIATDGNFVYALDGSYGLIYVYDNNGIEICVFGGGRGIGMQRGVFSDACAITLCGSDLLVVDSLNHTVTTFALTDYGKLVLEAQEKTMHADYLGAEPLWSQVRLVDNFSRLAAIGLGKAALQREDYSVAMEYAKESGDEETYNLSLSAVQTEFISQNFAWMLPLALLIIVGLTVLILITVKKRIVLVPNMQARTMFSCMTHPFRSFYDIKYKKAGSLLLGIIAVVVYYLTSVISVVSADFRYTSFDSSTYNALFQVVTTAGIIILWSVANWAISTLQQGKGKLKEVFLVTMYSTVPISIYNIISTPLTHALATSNSALISGLHTLAFIFTGLILCIGLMVIHDFSFPRLLFTAFLTIILMILIIFILFMIGILLSQFFSFIVSIITEASQW